MNEHSEHRKDRYFITEERGNQHLKPQHRKNYSHKFCKFSAIYDILCTENTKQWLVKFENDRELFKNSINDQYSNIDKPQNIQR